MAAHHENAVGRAWAPGKRQPPLLLAAVGKRVFWWCLVTGLAASALAALIAHQQDIALQAAAAAPDGDLAAVTLRTLQWTLGAIFVCIGALGLAVHRILKRWVHPPLMLLIDRMESEPDNARPAPKAESAREFSDINRRVDWLRSLKGTSIAALYGRLDIDKKRLDITTRELGKAAASNKKIEASLIRSEARFQTLIEKNADAILVIDTTGVVCYANAATGPIFGRSLGDLVGAQFGFPIGGEEATTIEVIDPSGHVHIVEMRITEMGWDGVQAHVAILRDVTAQIETNRRLTQSEQKFRTLFENSKDAIYFSTREGRIIDCNLASESMLGYTVNALKTMKWSDLLEDPGDYLFFQLQIETQGAVKDYPFRLATRNGMIRDCLVTASIVQSALGEIIGYQGIIRDMTEITEYRKNLEALVTQRTAQLKQSLADVKAANQRIAGIISSVADGLIVTDARSRMSLINPAAESLLSVHAAQVIGQPLAAVVDHDGLREHLLSCLDSEVGCQRYEFDSSPDEENRSKSIRALTSVLTDADGAPSGTVTLLSDVTYEQEVNRMKSEFISTAAHELRTPLTSICGFSEILLSRDDLKEHERTRFLKYVYEQANVLSSIINDLLDLSRMEAGAGYAINKGSHDIANIVRGIAERFQLETSRHTFFLDLPEAALIACCDRGKMEQVLDNIYSNAIKYAPTGGIIETELRQNDQWVQIAVTDSGIGMTQEQVSRIFEKFYRADASNTAVAGTGLGMSIVRHIVETHGGQVSVKSRKNIGTTVSVRIPVHGPCEASAYTEDAAWQCAASTALT